MTTPFITATDLTMGFGDVNLLEHQSFEVMRGEVFAILGRSGCGKSVLLKHMTGLIKPDSGSILFRGSVPTPFPARSRARARSAPRSTLFPPEPEAAPKVRA